MKRTGEKILSIIAMIIYAFTILFSTLMNVIVINDEENLEKVYQAMRDENPDSSTEILNESLELVVTYTRLLLIMSILALILGIVAYILLTKYQRDKLAGRTFLIVGILGFFLTFPFGLAGSLLFIIVGIMCLVRKPKSNTEKKSVKRKVSKFEVWAATGLLVSTASIVAFMYFFGYRLNGELIVKKSTLPYDNPFLYILLALIFIGLFLAYMMTLIILNKEKVNRILIIRFALLPVLIILLVFLYQYFFSR